MDTIYYNGYEYRKIYDHEAGGTYFESDIADIVTSCWNIYSDETVKCLWNGRAYYLGKLVGNRVIKR